MQAKILLVRQLDVAAGDLGPLGQVILSAFRRRAVTAPLLRLPADDLVYAFNFVRIPATADLAEAQRLVAANRAAYERVSADGGTLCKFTQLSQSVHDLPPDRELR